MGPKHWNLPVMGMGATCDNGHRSWARSSQRQDPSRHPNSGLAHLQKHVGDAL